MKSNAGNRISSKFIFILILLFIFLSNNFYYIHAKASSSAADNKKVISINDKGEATASIFNESDGLWAPGITKTKSFYLQNNSSDNCTLNKIDFKALLKDNAGNLIDTTSSKFNYFNESMNATLVCNNKTIFSGKFSELINHEFDLKDNITIDAHSKIKLDLTFSMDSAADASLQNLKANIDMKFWFHALDGSSLISILTNTGSIFNTQVLFVVGIALVAVGSYIIFKKKSHSHK